MIAYKCGPCCFSAKLEKKERKTIYLYLIDLLEVNPSVKLLCPDCDKQLFIKNGVLTTKIADDFDSQADKQSSHIFSEENVFQYSIFNCGPCGKPVVACVCG